MTGSTLCGGAADALGTGVFGAFVEGVAVLGEGAAGLACGLAAPGEVADCSAVATVSAATATEICSANARARPPAAMTETNNRPCMCVSPDRYEVSLRPAQLPLGSMRRVRPWS